MKLFPGRTLEELDEIDVARLSRALEAASISSDVETLQGWTKGRSSQADIAAVDKEIQKEFRECLEDNTS